MSFVPESGASERSPAPRWPNTERVSKDEEGYLTGCLVVSSTATALLAAFVARVRLYNSVGTYKGWGNMGIAPFGSLALSLCVGVLAWVVWRRTSKCARNGHHLQDPLK